MVIIALTFAADLVPGFKTGLKGNPVKNRSYPRSCKEPLQTSLKGRLKSKIVEECHCFGSSEWEGFSNALSQKTCHIA
jgi:hypothetical protein